MKEKVVNLALIASGGGTDADAIMKAWAKGNLLGVNIKLLVSTKEGAGCLDKAKEHNVPSVVVNRKKLKKEGFDDTLRHALREHNIELVFLVGCIVKISLTPGIVFYNIHPADPGLFGGKGMYGLDPHKEVLRRIKEDIEQDESENKNKKFFTYPTVHRVNEKYDDGPELVNAVVEIPENIIYDLMARVDIELLARRLQTHVLPHEWQLLPTAVAIAAKELRKT